MIRKLGELTREREYEVDKARKFLCIAKRLNHHAHVDFSGPPFAFDWTVLSTVSDGSDGCAQKRWCGKKIFS